MFKRIKAHYKRIWREGVCAALVFEIACPYDCLSLSYIVWSFGHARGTELLHYHIKYYNRRYW
jgi:hypothetical protein